LRASDGKISAIFSGKSQFGMKNIQKKKDRNKMRSAPVKVRIASLGQ
jgi:hypothetical protein